MILFVLINYPNPNPNPFPFYGSSLSSLKKINKKQKKRKRVWTSVNLSSFSVWNYARREGEDEMVLMSTGHFWTLHMHHLTVAVLLYFKNAPQVVTVYLMRITPITQLQASRFKSLFHTRHKGCI